MSAKRAGTGKAVRSEPQGPRLCTLEVFIIGGPISEKFLKRNPQISRAIEIRGDQTLADLHHAIFAAFDRWEEHMYEFQFGKGPNDPKGKRYVLPQRLRERRAKCRRKRGANHHGLAGLEGRSGVRLAVEKRLVQSEPWQGPTRSLAARVTVGNEADQYPVTA